MNQSLPIDLLGQCSFGVRWNKCKDEHSRVELWATLVEQCFYKYSSAHKRHCYWSRPNGEYLDILSPINQFWCPLILLLSSHCRVTIWHRIRDEMYAVTKVCPRQRLYEIWGVVDDCQEKQPNSLNMTNYIRPNNYSIICIGDIANVGGLVELIWE